PLQVAPAGNDPDVCELRSSLVCLCRFGGRTAASFDYPARRCLTNSCCTSVSASRAFGRKRVDESIRAGTAADVGDSEQKVAPKMEAPVKSHPRRSAPVKSAPSTSASRKEALRRSASWKWALERLAESKQAFGRLARRKSASLSSA